jgi:hypothetical protein
MPPLIPAINLDVFLLQAARCDYLIALEKMQPGDRAGSIRAAACGLISEREAEMLRAHYRCEVRNA